MEKTFGVDVRVCDRTALILDIFNQRAATHEAALQATASPFYICAFFYMEISIVSFALDLLLEDQHKKWVNGDSERVDSHQRETRVVKSGQQNGAFMICHDLALFTPIA